MSLLALQQEFRSWLTSERADVAARFGEPARAGLAVYLNNYRSQLMACLAESYAITRAWIGDTAFNAAAATHIDAVEPHAWTLDDYGLDFADTLDTLYPEDPEIGELARLERDLASAFVGPDAPPVDSANLAHIDWDAAIIKFVPTVTFLAVTTNVGAIWSAISEQKSPPPAERLPEPANIVIWRHNFTATFRTMTAEEAALLEQARAGQCFGVICATLVARMGEEHGPVLAGSLLSQWLADGLIREISS